MAQVDTFTSPLESEDPAVRAVVLQQTLYKLRAQLSAEREHGIPTAEALSAQLSALQKQQVDYDAQSRTAKALAKRRKQEIDDWKQWFHTLPDDEKVDGLVKLRSEIDWRADELTTLTVQISELLAQQASIGGEIEVVKQQQMALDAGVYARPIEEDPRLVRLEEALHSIPKS